MRDTCRKRIASLVANIGGKSTVAERGIIETTGLENTVGPVGPFIRRIVRGHGADASERHEGQKRQRPLQERQIAESAHRVHAERLQILPGTYGAEHRDVFLLGPNVEELGRPAVAKSTSSI